MQAAPSQAELLHREFKTKKEKLKGVTLEDIAEKYGDAAAKDKLPEELLLGQTERQVEYDRAGRVIKGQVRKEGRAEGMMMMRGWEKGFVVLGLSFLLGYRGVVAYTILKMLFFFPQKGGSDY